MHHVRNVLLNTSGGPGVKNDGGPQSLDFFSREVRKIETISLALGLTEQLPLPTRVSWITKEYQVSFNSHIGTNPRVQDQSHQNTHSVYFWFKYLFNHTHDDDDDSYLSASNSLWYEKV